MGYKKKLEQLSKQLLKCDPNREKFPLRLFEVDALTIKGVKQPEKIAKQCYFNLLIYMVRCKNQFQGQPEFHEFLSSLLEEDPLINKDSLISPEESLFAKLYVEASDLISADTLEDILQNVAIDTDESIKKATEIIAKHLYKLYRYSGRNTQRRCEKSLVRYLTNTLDDNDGVLKTRQEELEEACCPLPLGSYFFYKLIEGEDNDFYDDLTQLGRINVEPLEIDGKFELTPSVYDFEIGAAIKTFQYVTNQFYQLLEDKQQKKQLSDFVKMLTGLNSAASSFMRCHLDFKTLIQLPPDQSNGEIDINDVGAHVMPELDKMFGYVLSKLQLIKCRTPLLNSLRSAIGKYVALIIAGSILTVGGSVLLFLGLSVACLILGAIGLIAGQILLHAGIQQYRFFSYKNSMQEDMANAAMKVINTMTEVINGCRKKVICYLDFDGTLTDLPGSSLVYTEFYSFLQAEESSGYPKAIFKENIIDLLRLAITNPGEFKETYKITVPKNLGLSKGAKDFLETMQKMGGTINIVSKNCAPYIKAMLQASNINLTHIFIKDVVALKGWGGKSEMIRWINKEYQFQDQLVVVCDDDSDDFNSVCSVFNDPNSILSFNSHPGEFNWQDISKQVQQLRCKLPDDLFTYKM